jgi:NDP-sugar pyrophosphorylase family protein
MSKTLKNSDNCGVILAAGRGSRMHPFTDDFPKPLLPICGAPLISYQLAIMRRLGIKKVFIVIGHCGFEIVRAIGDGSKYDVSVHFVEQKEMLGIAHALGQLESEINTPFLLFLGDIFFVSQDFEKMILEYRGQANAVLAAKVETNKEAIRRNFLIITEKDGTTVKRVIEKPRYIENNLKGCGLYWFDLHIFDAIRRTPRTAMRDEYELTEALQIMIDDGMKVKVSAVIEQDLNLTYPEDLHFINLFELKRRGLSRLVGANCRIANEAKIANSVIGDNVRIDADIGITNSVVFSGVQIAPGFKSTGLLQNVIVTPSRVISIPDRNTLEPEK